MTSYSLQLIDRNSLNWSESNSAVNIAVFACHADIKVMNNKLFVARGNKSSAEQSFVIMHETSFNMWHT